MLLLQKKKGSWGLNTMKLNNAYGLPISGIGRLYCKSIGPSTIIIKMESYERFIKYQIIFVSRSLAIANQIISILDEKNLKQRDLASMLGQKEAEISKWLTSFHHFTVKSIAKTESALGEQMIYSLQESE